MSIEGECPADEVAAWFDALPEDLEALLGPLEAVSSGKSTSIEDYENLDVELIRERIVEQASTPVPACVEGVRDEYLALTADAATALEFIKSPDNGIVAYRAAVSMMALMRSVRTRLDRMREAEAALEARLGIVLDQSDDMMEPPDDGR